MAGFCGWMGLAATAEPPAVLLEAMATGLNRPGADAAPPPLDRRVATPEAAVHLRGGHRTADFTVDRGLKVALLGQPRWTDAALATLAKDRGDAAALAAAYRRHDVALFDHVAGPLAVAIADAPRRRTLIATDRMGLETVYWTSTADAFVFGTSTQSVRRHPAVSDTLSPQTISECVLYGVSFAPRTIYADQARLLPAQYALWDDGVLRTDFYWRMPYRTDGPRDVPALMEELKRLLRQAVARCIDGEDPTRLGAFLSGGLDSSSVAGMLAAVSPGNARTFTIGFDHGHFDESPFARLAAEAFGTTHHEHTLTQDEALELLPRAAAAYDEPFANSSAIPALSCAHAAARHGITCLLAGDGGDELFAGNARYVDQQILEIYQRVPAMLRRRLIEPLLFGLPGAGGTWLFRKGRRYVRYSNVPLPRRYYAPNPATSVSVADIFSPDLLAQVSEAATDEVFRDVWDRTATPALVHRMMHVDLKETLADNDLRKVTGMCRLAGVPVRFPMLDDDLVEFSARIPPDVLLPWRRLRDFYKKAMAGWLPDAIITKRKQGFGMPYNEWVYTDDRIRPLAIDALAGMRGRGYLSNAFLDSLDPEAMDPNARNPDLLWNIVVLELWLRTYRAPKSMTAAA